MTLTGEERAWELLAQQSPENIQASAGAAYDPTANAFRVKCFGADILVSIQNRTIDSFSDVGNVFIRKFKFLANHE